MEHRKEYTSHRDMLDDAMLQRILADMTDERDDTRTCGCMSHGDSRYQSSRSERTGNSPCDKGCGSARQAYENRQNRGNCKTCDERQTRGNCQVCGDRQSRSDCQTCGDRHPSGEWNPAESDTCPDKYDCVSGRSASLLRGYPLAMVYSPNQEWEGILEAEEALDRGTIFTGLLFPWYPSRCKDNGGCGCGRN